MTDHPLLLDQLVRTERQISTDAQILLRQEAIIDELERRGESAAYLRALMRDLREMHAMRIADRDRMRAALESLHQNRDADARTSAPMESVETVSGASSMSTNHS